MKDYPVIKITIAFICGIALQEVITLPLWALFSSAIMIAVLSIVSRTKATYLFPLILILSANLGSVSLAIHKYKTPNEILNIERIKDIQAYGEISGIQLLRNNEIRFNLDTDSIKAGESAIAKNLTLLCSVKDVCPDSTKALYNSLHLGNRIVINGNYSKGRDRRNPYEFDYRKYLQQNDIDGVIYSYNANEINVLDPGKSYIVDYIFSIRKNIDSRIKSLHNAETAALLRGLLLGDKSEIDYETREEFINAGIAHILAVSGLHVGYVLLIFTFMFSRFNLKLRITASIFGLVFFLLITGGYPSVFRAVVMASVILTAQLSGRSTNIYNSLAISALILLLITPNDLFNAGFQLSFAAVLSIAYFYNFFKFRINSLNICPIWLKKLILFMLVSVSAQIGTLPFVLMYFGKLSVISILVNIVVIPLAGVIVAVGIFTLALSYIFTPLAYIYASANEFFTWLLYALADFAGNIRYSYLAIRDFSILDAAIYFMLLLSLFWFYPYFQNAKAKIIIVCLVIANIVLFTRLDNINLLPDNQLSVMMIDVGQGDAFLIKFPDGKSALVDAGNSSIYFDNGERVIYPLLSNLGVDKVNYGFVSHMDADHSGGFYSLIKHGIIDSVYKPPIDTSDSDDIEFETALKNSGTKYANYPHGILNIGAARIYSLSNYDDPVFNSMKRNDRSAVLMLVYGNTSFLFTGDASSKTEKIMAAEYGSFLNCDVLKVSHHGSRTGSSEEFLKFVEPEYSLISAGINNRFNHPATETLGRLEAINTKILRTDTSGAVILRSDGEHINIVNWKN